MRITVRQLKSIIREEVTRALDEGDSHRVTFTAKNGTKETRVFPNRKLADMYARTVKAAVVEPVDIETADVAVQSVAPAGLDDLRQSAKTFYKQTMAGQTYDPSRPTGRAQSATPRADPDGGEDLAADTYRAAIMGGASQEDAWADVDSVTVPGWGNIGTAKTLPSRRPRRR